MTRLDEQARALAEGVLAMAAVRGTVFPETASVGKLAELFRTAFLLHTRRLPAEGRDEFISAVVLELLEFEHQSLVRGSGPILAIGGTRAVREADRASDRVRHRIVRQAQRHYRCAPLNHEPEASTLADDTEALVRDLSSVLSHEEAIVLQMSLEGWTVKQIADKLGWTPQAVYALRKNLRPRIKSMLTAAPENEA